MEKFITLKTSLILNSVIIFFCLISFFKGCSVSLDLSDATKKNKILTVKVDNLNSKVDSIAKLIITEEKEKVLLENTMYKFLIFEEDIDKKRISLSEIQNRLDKK